MWHVNPATMVKCRLSRFPFFVILTILATLFFRGFPPFSSPTTSSALFPARKSVQFRASSFNWTEAKLFFPPNDIKPLPKGKSEKLPPVQHSFSSASRQNHNVNEERRRAVEHAFARSWDAYKSEAWLWDEVKPMTGGGKNTFG